MSSSIWAACPGRPGGGRVDPRPRPRVAMAGYEPSYNFCTFWMAGLGHVFWLVNYTYDLTAVFHSCIHMFLYIAYLYSHTN